MGEIAILQQLRLLESSIGVFWGEWRVFTQATVHTSASKAAVIPPLCEEAFTASRTPKANAPKACHRIENHPTNRRNVKGYCRVKQACGHNGNHRHDRHIAQECKQGDIPTFTVLLPRIIGIAHVLQSKRGLLAKAAWLSITGLCAYWPVNEWYGD